MYGNLYTKYCIPKHPIIPGVQNETIHCLISCNVKPVKAISIKYKAFYAQRINLDFNILQFIFHAILTKKQVFEVGRSFRNWRKNDKNAASS